MPELVRTFLEIKKKPLRQAQEWSYSSAGIRSNKKTHINCGSSARMADIVGTNDDPIRRQG
jgi:hypothetical protein